MTIEERFKREHLEMLRRLQEQVSAALLYVEMDMPLVRDDTARERFMKCHCADFQIGDFEVHDRRRGPTWDQVT